MTKKYTLSGSKRYIAKLERAKRATDIDISQLTQALKNFAQSNDREYFAKTVDAYVQCVTTEIPEDTQATRRTNDMTKEPLAFLEWLCMGLDHSFTTVGHHAWAAAAGMTTEGLPLGEIQSFFRDLYGSHFYQDH